MAGLGLLAAVFWMGATAPEITFDAFVLAEAGYATWVQVLLLLGFAVAFMVKLPVPPFHAWLPDAHTQAPTAGSILLAGLLLKTGAYGLFRFPPAALPRGPDGAGALRHGAGGLRRRLWRDPGLRAVRREAADRLHLHRAL